MGEPGLLLGRIVSEARRPARATRRSGGYLDNDWSQQSGCRGGPVSHFALSASEWRHGVEGLPPRSLGAKRGVGAGPFPSLGIVAFELGCEGRNV